MKKIVELGKSLSPMPRLMRLNQARRLKIKEPEEKVAQYESGSTVNQNIIDAVMSQFFSSDEWLGAQIDNFITSGNKETSPTLSVTFIYFITSVLTDVFLYSFQLGMLETHY